MYPVFLIIPVPSLKVMSGYVFNLRFRGSFLPHQLWFGCFLYGQELHPYILKATRAGIKNHYEASHPVAEDHTLPFSCDMLIHGIGYVYNSGHPQDECVNVALMTARCRLLRVSEVLKVRNEDHFLRSQDVDFEFTYGTDVKFYSAHEIVESLREFLSGITIYVRSRMNDISGRGQMAYFKFDCVTNQGFNLAGSLFNWAIRARLKIGDPFFSYRQCWKLSYNIFNIAHKKIASSLGMDSTNFSTHSSRVGGACTLAAVGFPDSFIMLYGGWSSLAFLYYVRMSASQYADGLNALSNPSVFTMTDVRRLIPGFKAYDTTRMSSSSPGVDLTSNCINDASKNSITKKVSVKKFKVSKVVDTTVLNKKPSLPRK